MNDIVKEARDKYKKFSANFSAGSIWDQTSYNYRVLNAIIDVAQPPEQIISLLEKTDFYSIFGLRHIRRLNPTFPLP